MKKNYFILPFLALLASIPVNSQTVFTDNFNRASFTTGSTGGTPATTYTFVLGSGTIGTTLVSGSNYEATITSGAGAGANAKNYFWAPLNVYSAPFNLTLSSNNPAIITWTFNMQTNTAATGVPTQAAMGGGVDLCGNAAGNIYNGSPTGYGVLFYPGAAGGVALVKFSGGMNASTLLITPTTTMPKTDYFSVRVTYDASANNWSLYVRDDGASAFADPSSGVTLQQGSTVTDATYVSTAMVNFGVVYTNTSGAGKIMNVDNYTVTDVLPPCSGTPVPGTVHASTSSGCGLSYTSNLSLLGAQQATGLTYQWASSTDDASWSSVSGATNPTYAATVTGNVYYTCSVTCTNSTTTAATPGAPLYIDVPKTATLPFFESFESSWQNGCGTADQPDSFWVNTFATGNRSWRRSDDFTTAGWSGGSAGIYSPTASNGSYSADFSSYSVASGNTGALNLYINLPVGTNQISYDYINEDGTDDIVCQISTDGGVTFTTVDAPPAVATTWTTRTFTTTLAANPAVIRFLATSDFGVTNIGLDNIRICQVPANITGITSLCAGYSDTLGDASGAGTWSSNNTGIAAVGTTGIYTGISGGVATITFNSGLNCFATTTVNINPAPSVITPITLCGNQTAYLSDSIGGGSATYFSTNTAVATVDPLAGLVTGVSTGTVIISYTLTTGCYTTTTVTVNTTPTPLSGTFNLCSGISSTYTSTPGGGTWTSNSPFQASVDSSTGVVTGVSAGNPVISYTISSGCYAIQTTTINNSPLAISYTTGTPNLCIFSSTTLGDATPGGVWHSSSGADAAINASTGLMTGLNPGVTTISYTLSSNACYAAQSFTINPLPDGLVSVNGGGSYCIGDSGVHITLGSGGHLTQATANYYLYNGSSLVGSLPGNGGVLDYGLLTAAGTYTVQAATATGCAVNLSGSATVGINTLPSSAFGLTVSNGGGYCIGSGGVDIGLSGSEAGVIYYLMLYPGITVSTVFGTGSAIDLNPSGIAGPNTYAPGIYSVVALGDLSGCTANIPGSIEVNVNALPAIYNVTGGGSYCPYASGQHVGLDFSDPGVTYSLFDGTDTVSYLPGANSPLDYYPVTAGSYTIIATNGLTGCTNTMTGSATVSTGSYLLPSVYTIGEVGSGSYCAGGAGVDINLATSDFGVSYQLYNGVTAIGLPVSGGSTPLDMGSQRLGGSYTIVATDGTTDCYAAMSGSASVMINPLPAIDTVTGGGAYCVGGSGVAVGVRPSEAGMSYQLMSGGSMAGSSVAGTGGALNLGLGTSSAGTNTSYMVVATDTLTLCTANMYGNAVVTANTLPELYNVTGGGGYCSGGTGRHVNLDWSSTGVNYTLYNGGVATGSAAGSNSGIDFGLQTNAGAYTVVGNNPATGCTDTMSGSVTVTINPSPTEYTVASTSSSYCVGGSGVTLNLTGSDLGLSYQLYLGGIPIGGTVTGTGSAISFGLQTGAGAYTVIASNTGSLCTAMMTSSPVITINTLPGVNTVTGGGGYCAGGSGIAIGLNGSTLGHIYELMNSTGMVVSTVTGTGAAISFGPQTGAGTYKAMVTDPSTTCRNNMTDSAVVMINALPAVDTVIGGGGYCVGSDGVHIGLNNSSSGVNYSLYDGTTLAGTVSGSTGSSVDFGLTSATGTYRIAGTDAATGCTDNMYGNPVVVANALPPVYTMFGGGGYCAGGSGLHVNLSGSTLGMNYQLYYNGIAEGGVVGATGAALDFGIKTAPGNYTVMATDPATLCTSNMAGISAVMINPLPAVYNVTGGGGYCAGGAGVAIGLDNSTIGMEYQLYNGTAIAGSPVWGADMAISFGLRTASGVYTIVAINPGTGCTSTQSGSAGITVNPVVAPSVSLSMGYDLAICEGTVLSITASAVNGGSSPAYQWSVNGTNVGGGDTYTYVPLNGDLVTAVVTSSAPCAEPMTAGATGLITVAPYETPAAAITATPGAVTCAGTPVTFTATAANWGSAPTYTWLKDNIPVSTGLTYNYTPANGDVIGFMLESNLPCRTADVVFSNTELMEVNQATVPSVSITAYPGTSIVAGEALTLNATVSNAGATPGYQWLLNGIAMPGANGPTLESGNFANHDSVTCVVTNSNACGEETGANSVVISVGALSVQQVTNGGSISVSPNPSNGTFTVKGSLGTTGDAQVTLEVTDVVGQVVYTRQVKAAGGNISEQVQLNGAANGMYLLNVRTSQGNTVFHIVVAK